MKNHKLTLAVGVVVFAAAFPFLISGEIKPIFATIVETARGFGTAGAVFVLLLQMAVCIVGILPASLIGIASGVLYGFAAGSVISGIGTALGAAGGYYLGRFGGRRLIGGFGSRSLGRVRGFLSAEGWKSIFLIRLSPVLPFSAASIALGAAGTRPRDYAIGTTASFPALFAYVYLGSVLGPAALSDPTNGLRAAPLFLALGIVSAVALAGRFISYARSQQ
jgi:uncharacterized membrane protein YdjX (TVP38/TMEM64 family)